MGANGVASSAKSSVQADVKGGVSAESVGKLDWEKCPLIPTIVQERGSKEVLMLAYSSRESLALSLQSGVAHYYSRSKQRIWQKGEQSGHIQRIACVRYDCDNDSLLFIVSQSGAACHTGEKSCFYRELAGFDKGAACADSQVDLTESSADLCLDSVKSKVGQAGGFALESQACGERGASSHSTARAGLKRDCLDSTACAESSANLDSKAHFGRDGEERGDLSGGGDSGVDSALLPSQALRVQSPYHTLDELSHIIESKRFESASSSYTASLLHKGANAVCKKIIEEAGELCLAIKDREQEEIIHECADLLYHALVGLSLERVSLDRVYSELRGRMGQSGLEEKASRNKG